MSIPIRTIQRWEHEIEDGRKKAQKKPPKNKLSEEERKKVKDICCSDSFVDKSPKVIVPILAEKGKYIASESTMYRILREESMVHHREESKKPKKRIKPKELKATGPNQVWSWDITYLKSKIKGIFFYLYMFMDIWSRKIVGWDIFETQDSEHAKYVFEKIKEENDVDGIYLHSDNGSPMKGATFLATLQWLGVIPSFSRPSCSNDNAYSESLFKTIKYRPSFPKAFETIEDAKEFMHTFINWYNNVHRHSGINYVTPAQRHNGYDKEILKIRRETYKKAMNKHPERWANKQIKEWSWQSEVILNPENNILKETA